MKWCFNHLLDDARFRALVETNIPACGQTNSLAKMRTDELNQLYSICKKLLIDERMLHPNHLQLRIDAYNARTLMIASDPDLLRARRDQSKASKKRKPEADKHVKACKKGFRHMSG